MQMRSETVQLELTSAATQPDAADVVIIGGGIMGTSIAWHLATAGVQNIVLIEQGDLGSGSSAKPLGGVRANFSDPGNIQLGKRSLEAFARFAEDFGHDAGLQRVGYLFLARTEAQLAGLERGTQVQNSFGIGSRMLNPAEAHELNPLLNRQALLGASFSPADGYAEPSRVVEGYATAAQQTGVTMLTRTQVMDIDTAGSAVTSVTTQRGTIATEAVICCAGAWSAQIGAMAGVELPVVPVRRMIGMTPQRSRPHPTVPFTLDLETTLYFHNRGSGLVLGISHEEAPGFNREFGYQWLPEFNRAAAAVAPELAHPELAEGWAGLYENTPDRNALIGQAPQLPGFFYATGFSGHGFLQGPAVGELMADMYLGRESFMDPAPFSAERFDHAGSLHEMNII